MAQSPGIWRNITGQWRNIPEYGATSRYMMQPLPTLRQIQARRWNGATSGNYGAARGGMAQSSKEWRILASFDASLGKSRRNPLPRTEGAGTLGGYDATLPAFGRHTLDASPRARWCCNLKHGDAKRFTPGAGERLAKGRIWGAEGGATRPRRGDSKGLPSSFGASRRAGLLCHHCPMKLRFDRRRHDAHGAEDI
jgi:hypothetical protein